MCRAQADDRRDMLFAALNVKKSPKFDTMAASQSADTPFQPAARQQVMSPSLRLPGEDRQGPQYGRIHEQRLDGGAPIVNGYGSVPVTSAGHGVLDSSVHVSSGAVPMEQSVHAGLSVPVSLGAVPVEQSVPVDASAPVSHSVPANTSVPENMSVPANASVLANSGPGVAPGYGASMDAGTESTIGYRGGPGFPQGSSSGGGAADNIMRMEQHVATGAGPMVDMEGQWHLYPSPLQSPVSEQENRQTVESTRAGRAAHWFARLGDFFQQRRVEVHTAWSPGRQIAENPWLRPRTALQSGGWVGETARSPDRPVTPPSSGSGGVPQELVQAEVSRQLEVAMGDMYGGVMERIAEERKKAEEAMLESQRLRDQLREVEAMVAEKEGEAQRAVPRGQSAPDPSSLPRVTVPPCSSH